MSDSLKDAFDGLGDGEFKDEIVERYDGQLARQFLMGEELDVANIGTSTRKYDYGQADGQTTVTEYGVKIVFDSTMVEKSELEEGGAIRREIQSLADELITKPVDYIELSFVRDAEQEYEVWVVLDADSL